MKFIDIPDPNRITNDPNDRTVIFSDGKITQDDIEIQKIELLQYKIKNDEELGDYSIITALVDTDHGIIEILYDEGYRGDNALVESVNMLIQNLGLSGLILRSIISLKNQLEKNEK
tara:strand:+ start:606 stop:953 length:348 start_codon:yes stop_codon:yes gene_type:complete